MSCQPEGCFTLLAANRLAGASPSSTWHRCNAVLAARYVRAKRCKGTTRPGLARSGSHGGLCRSVGARQPERASSLRLACARAPANKRAPASTRAPAEGAATCHAPGRRPPKRVVERTAAPATRTGPELPVAAAACRCGSSEEKHNAEARHRYWQPEHAGDSEPAQGHRGAMGRTRRRAGGGRAEGLPACCYTPTTPLTLTTAAPRGAFASRAIMMALAPPTRRPARDSGSISTAALASPQPIGSPASGKLDSDLSDRTLTVLSLCRAPLRMMLRINMPVDDSDSESDRASAASTMDLAASLVAFRYGLGLCSGVPRGHRNRARRLKMTVLQTRLILTNELPLGRLTTLRLFERTRFTLYSGIYEEPQPITMAQWPLPMLHPSHGCTNGTGPRPSIEPRTASESGGRGKSRLRAPSWGFPGRVPFWVVLDR